MTTLTPQQMRALAGNLDAEDGPVYMGAGAAALRTAADEVDRLRAVIENAPHSRTCELEDSLSTSSRWDRECTCWKASAL